MNSRELPEAKSARLQRYIKCGFESTYPGHPRHQTSTHSFMIVKLVM